MTTHVDNSGNHKLHNLFVNLVCGGIYIALAVSVSIVYLVSHGTAIQL
jgi:hypothetical protein